VRGRIELHNPLQHLQPGHIWHDQISHNNLRPMTVDKVDPLLRVRGSEHLHSLPSQGRGQEFKTARIVINNDDRDRVSHRGHALTFSIHASKAARTCWTVWISSQSCC